MDTRIYLAFTPKFPVNVAIIRFEKRYGCKPDRIFIEKGLLKLGPVADKQVEGDNKNENDF